MIERVLRLCTLNLIGDRNIPELSIHNGQLFNATSRDARPSKRIVRCD
jgi:hypothetical protein